MCDRGPHPGRDPSCERRGVKAAVDQIDHPGAGVAKHFGNDRRVDRLLLQPRRKGSAEVIGTHVLDARAN